MREAAPRVSRPVMFQEWRAISFLHWRTDAGLIGPMLPPRLTPDIFDGSPWIGLTPFRLNGLRLRFGPRLPWLSSFPETNLRTYVKGPAGDGIWFFSLDAARVLAVLGARWIFGLPYYWARMSIEVKGSRLRYQSTRSRRATMDLSVER